MIVTFDSPTRDENWSPKDLSTLIKSRQTCGEDVKYLLVPTPIESNADDDSNQSCTAARQRTKQPKNHLKANRQALKEKQQKQRHTKEKAVHTGKLKALKEEQKKLKLFGKVRSRVFDQASSSIPPPKTSCAPQHINSTSISLPFSSEESVSSEQSNFHIAFGKKVPVSAPAHRPNSSIASVASSGSRHHKLYGKVPTYITDRKAMIERREEEQRIIQENLPPAPGLVLLEESERLDTLKLLKDNENEAREALQNIPFSMNHQRAARLREAIDYRLKEIEDTRKIFSKEKVFVARDD